MANIYIYTYILYIHISWYHGKVYIYLGLPAGHKLLMSHSVFNFSGGPLRIDKNLENRQFLEFGDFYGFMFSEQPSGS